METSSASPFIKSPGDHVVFMSNGGFDGAPRRFLAQLQQD